MFTVEAMPQVTLYLDERTDKMMRERAAAAGVPYSRWVAQLIHAQAEATWPPDVARLFGAFPEMPLSEDLRSRDVADIPREPW
jgi:hypothetical protein